MKKRCFTFPELVFTLTALSAMMLLLFSGIFHIRERAKGELCRSQLESFGKMTLSYNETYKTVPLTPLWDTGKKLVSTHNLYLYWRVGLIPKEKGIGSPGNCFFARDYFCPSLLERKNVSSKTASDGALLYSSNCSYGVRKDTRNVNEGKKNLWRRDYFDLSGLNSPSTFNFYGCATRRTTGLPIRFYFSRLAGGNTDFLASAHEGKAGIWAPDGHTELIGRDTLEKTFGGNARCWNE